MPSWLEEIPSSSPERPSTQRARSGSRAPSAPFTPCPQRRSPSLPSPGQGSFDSPLIDPSLRGQPAENTQESQVSLDAPTSAQRPSVGGKQPKRHFVQDTDVSDPENEDDDDRDPTDDDADISSPAKRRRFAQTEGEKLGLTERSIMDAKRFANVSLFLLTLVRCIVC